MSDLLFPEVEPYQTHQLKVSNLHTLYIEEVGNPNGQPVIFLHGGPGGGVTPEYRRYFDPEHYRVILFDQRGCGKSTPHAELTENSTWHLVEDIERIRKHLNIEKWMVFGGSWGSTLALTYSISHPTSVSHLTLRGIFMCREKELNWFYQEGASRLYPDAWEKYISIVPECERDNIMAFYYRRLTGPQKEDRLKAAQAWSVWEAATSKLIQSHDLMEDFDHPEFALAFARIECHYFMSKIFFDSEDYIIKNIDKIRHIPCEIVHGRYDVVCPLESAWELHKAWPESKLHIIEDAGHSLSETGIQKAILDILERFKV